MIFVVKVTNNKEEQAAELIAMNAKKKEINISAIASPKNLRGYLLLEASTKENAELAIYKVPYVKGLLNKIVEWKDVVNLFKPPSEVMDIGEGDIVEITSDAFKNEKARVKRINKQRGEAVVELLQATVPMPVFVKLDNLRVIRKEKPETGEIKEEKVEE
ncbi:MAG: transcription elongation factor Spt5 [Candidatus Pacearchaeota archaeon]